MNRRFKDILSEEEKLLDELINVLYEGTEDHCDIQRIDEILERLEQIGPSIFEPFSVEESYQRFIERLQKMGVQGALGELPSMTGMEEIRA